MPMPMQNYRCGTNSNEESLEGIVQSEFNEEAN